MVGWLVFNDLFSDKYTNLPKNAVHPQNCQRKWQQPNTETMVIYSEEYRLFNMFTNQVNTETDCIHHICSYTSLEMQTAVSHGFKRYTLHSINHKRSNYHQGFPRHCSCVSLAVLLVKPSQLGMLFITSCVITAMFLEIQAQQVVKRLRQLSVSLGRCYNTH